MGAQTSKGFPYPVSTDTPDVPRDVKALADRLDAVVPYAMAAGSADVVLNNSTTGSVVVTLPAGRFSQAPILTATKRTGLGGAGPLIPQITASSATSFTVNLLGGTATQSITVPVHWTAVQMLTGSAPG